MADHGQTATFSSPSPRLFINYTRPTSVVINRACGMPIASATPFVDIDAEIDDLATCNATENIFQLGDLRWAFGGTAFCVSAFSPDHPNLRPRGWAKLRPMSYHSTWQTIQ